MNANQILSLKKSNRNWVENKIAETEENIKLYLPNIFTDRHSANTVSMQLNNIGLLKDALLIMQTAEYKAYENSGKEIDFNSFRFSVSE